MCYASVISLSQIDALDTLALLGDRDRFATSVEWIGKNLQFDIVSIEFLSLSLSHYLFLNRCSKHKILTLCFGLYIWS